MRHVSFRLSFSKLLCITAALLLGGAGLLLSGRAAGSELSPRSLVVQSELPGTTTTYTLSFTITTPGTLGSIEAQFCSNSPLDVLPCVAPSGFDASGAVLSGQTGEAGFSISAASTASDIILTRTAAAASAIPVTYTFDNIVNPSAAGSYYVRLHTYASTDATGGATDHGGLAYPITSAINLSTYVPPYIDMCVGVTITGFDCKTASGNYINLGDLSSAFTSSATTQINVATNAANGYTLRVTGHTLTSGNDTIAGLTTRDISRPGVAQFGLNLRKNNTPPVGSNKTGIGNGTVDSPYNTPDFFQFVPGDELASSPAPANYNTYTVSYIVNIPKGQPAGVYATTLTYVALGSF